MTQPRKRHRQGVVATASCAKVPHGGQLRPPGTQRRRWRRRRRRRGKQESPHQQRMADGKASRTADHFIIEKETWWRKEASLVKIKRQRGFENAEPVTPAVPAFSDYFLSRICVLPPRKVAKNLSRTGHLSQGDRYALQV